MAVNSLFTLPKALQDNIIPEPMSGCWLWTGSISANGYGLVGNWNERYAHRASYECLTGKIPAGLHLDHLCRVRSCVNPNHLEPVTKRENTLRGINPAATNARKTHCVNGHPFNVRNTYRTSTGGRSCRVCHAQNEREIRAQRRALNPIQPRQWPTHCAHGHIYEEANTYINEHGYRWCMTCRNQLAIKSRLRREARRLNGLTTPAF